MTTHKLPEITVEHKDSYQCFICLNPLIADMLVPLNEDEDEDEDAGVNAYRGYLDNDEDRWNQYEGNEDRYLDQMYEDRAVGADLSDMYAEQMFTDMVELNV